MTAFVFHAITWFPGSAWEPNVLQALPPVYVCRNVLGYVCRNLAIQRKCSEGAVKVTSSAELVNKKTALHLHYSMKRLGFVVEVVDECV